MASNVGLPATTVLTGASAANAAGYLDAGVARSNHTLVVVTGAGVTAGAVVLELSLDNTNWFSPTGNSITLAGANTTYQVSVTGIPAQFLRARISTAVVGGTITAELATA